MDLFAECLKALDNKATPLSIKESDKIETILQCVFPFIFSNIDWDKVEKKILLDSDYPNISINLKKLLDNSMDTSIYIIWDCCVPVLKTDLFSAINFFDEVTAVSTRTWFLNISQGYVIEWHWCGLKTIGLADEKKLLQCKVFKQCLDSLFKIKIISNEDQREIRRLTNRFSQPRYWNISSAYFVKSPLEVISCIQTVLKNEINKDIYIWWDDRSLPILEANFDEVMSIWHMISEVKLPFQIVDTATQYLINCDSDEIKITFNSGLKSNLMI